MNVESELRDILLVVSDTGKLSKENTNVKARLERLGYHVSLTEDTVCEANAADWCAVVCSSIIGPPNLKENLRDLETPVVSLGETLYPYLGLTDGGQESSGRESGRCSVEIVEATHSMSAGLSGVVRVISEEAEPGQAHGARELVWARPHYTAVKIAALGPKDVKGGGAAREREEEKSERRRKVVLFGYEAGADLADGERAPARRVGMFFDRETAVDLNHHGWALFDAAMRWAVGEELKQFTEVFREEWQEIRERRRHHGTDPLHAASDREPVKTVNGEGDAPERKSNGDAPAREAGAAPPPPNSRGMVECDGEECAPENLTGLALSGGGIRSATFCLGLLQGLQAQGLLRVFDYLSTVSGGGYLGGWWSAWLARYGQYSQVRSDYPRFALYDIRRPAKLATRFLDENKLSQLICKFFKEKDEGLLNRLLRESTTTTRDRKDFINYLNNLIESDEPRAALNDDAFIEKYPEAKEIRRLWNEDDGEPARLNRRLLELVYAAEIRRDIFPPREKIDPERAQPSFGEDQTEWAREHLRKSEEQAASLQDITCAGDDPIHHLRLFANYLTPRKGLFSKDTWRAIATISRNLVLTWLTLVPIIIAFVLAGHLYFAVRTPSQETGQVVAKVRQLLYDEKADAANGGVKRELAPALRETVRRTGIDEKALTAISSYKHDFIYPYRHVISLLRTPQLQQLLLEAEQMRRQQFTLEAEQASARAEELKMQAAGFVNASDTAQAEESAEAAERELAAADALRVRSDELSRPGNYADELEQRMAADLKERAWWAFYPLAFLLSLIVAMTSAWMISNTSGSKVLGWAGGITFWLLIVCWLAAFVQNSDNAFFKLPAEFFAGVRDGNFNDFANAWGVWSWAALAVWVAAVASMVTWAWRGARRGQGRGLVIDEDAGTKQHWRFEVQRTRATQVHTELLICFAVIASVLFLSGFGHELYVLAYYSGDAWVASAGWFAVLSTIVGAIFTAIKASPIGGGDAKETKHPSLVSRAIFALTPPFVLIVLAVLISGLAHAVLCYIGREPDERLQPLSIATFIGALLCILFAVYEVRWRTEKSVKWRLFTSSLLVILCAGVWLGFYVVFAGEEGMTDVPIAPLAFGALLIFFLAPRLAMDESKGKADSRHRSFRLVKFENIIGREFTWKQLLAISAGLAVAGVVALRLVPSLYEALISRTGKWASVPDDGVMLAVSAVTTSLFCVGLVAFEIYRGTSSNRRPLWLLAGVGAAMLPMLIFSMFDGETAPTAYLNYYRFPNAMLAHAIIGLLALALGLVIALGWLANPNALSMHQFYRDRLVRAYLGASNATRRRQLRQVTESVEGDDVLLWQMKNCQRGAPYHLINTTLNLAAGRDLTTVQRSSAMFVLSKRSCGSTRTGYRGTRRYMGGRLSLGTAIAASGAAASPNMGSRTPSASLAMLMTMLNVRLGFWAPTPNKGHWRKEQPELWPFYMLREFLSQTNELSSYSYLTDGGHFDNTGIYSLVERGCRYIVAADCGADPTPCFSDLGDAIRRCRIDFDAEISVDITPLLRGEKETAAAHFVVGRIVYSKQQARALKWSSIMAYDRSTNPKEREKHLKDFEKERRGIIVLIKPSRVGDETADVRQYAAENGVFPHQTTADQWFDESQFESYRRLGLFTAETAFASLAKAEELRLGKGPVTLDQIEKLFEEVLEDPATKKGTAEVSGYLRARFQSVVAEALERNRLKMTDVCTARMNQLIASGAGVLAGVDARPHQVASAEMALRDFFVELSRNLKTNGGGAGSNGDEEKVIHPKAFKDAFSSLSFPFR